jgi:hypothetical protein
MKKNWFRMMMSRKQTTKQCDIHVVRKRYIPKGWYVHEAGQDPLHLLWFVVLINFDDVANNVESPRHFVAEECDSFEEALQKCSSNVC